jgi:hypothetical protein
MAHCGIRLGHAMGYTSRESKPLGTILALVKRGSRMTSCQEGYQHCMYINVSGQKKRHSPHETCHAPTLATETLV